MQQPRTGTWSRGAVRWARWLLALNVGILALLVLTPDDGTNAVGVVAQIARALSQVTGAEYATLFPTMEFIANVLLFVPLGALLPLALGQEGAGVYFAALGIGCVGSIAIETAQLGIDGRVADPRDLVSNTLGVGVGLVILWVLRRSLKSRKIMGLTSCS